MKYQRISPAFLLAAAVITFFLLPAAIPAKLQDENAEKLSVITFAEVPSVEILEELEANGVELGEYLGKGSYYARLKGGERLTLPASIQIRSATAEDKYRLIDTIIDTSNDRNVVTLRGYFADGTDFSTARTLIESYGGSIDATKWGYGTTSVSFDIPVSSIENVAASDSVLALAPELLKKVHNAVAAQRSHVDLAREEYGLTGAGIAVAILDEGTAYEDNPDFGDRVTIADEGGKSTHATFVTGTILGDGGFDSGTLGMAYEANGVSFNLDDHISKFQRAAEEFGTRIINNSWGGMFGWEYDRPYRRWVYTGEQYNFGAYLASTREIDKFVHKRNVLVIFSAGNDRDDDGPPDGHYWRKTGDKEYQEVKDDPNPPGPDGQYRCTDPHSSAKNVICVGSTDSSDEMTDFSSWGPTADGRIKPEVVAKGVLNFSAYDSNGYSFWTGTSMSAAVVSGSAALLIEQFVNLQNRKPTAHELKGLICATAKDLGNAGPDYSFGFGLLDVQKAARLIERDDDENTILLGSIKKSKKVDQNKPKYYHFSLPSGAKNLRVLLVWTDPEGPAAQNISDIIDRQDPTLMNDLDLNLYWIKHRKKRDKVKNYEPYILDPDNPSATAKRGDNHIDNIELVEINNPTQGDWYIEVSAGTFKGGKKQNFALIVYSDGTLSSPVEATGQPEALQKN